jgi:hypothetical protein
MRHLAFVFLFVVAGSATAGGTEQQCTHEEMIVAESVQHFIESWGKFYDSYRFFGRCSDGVVSEAFTDTATNLMATQWNQLQVFNSLAKKGPRFLRLRSWSYWRRGKPKTSNSNCQVIQLLQRTREGRERYRTPDAKPMRIEVTLKYSHGYDFPGIPGAHDHPEDYFDWFTLTGKPQGTQSDIVIADVECA